jgi:carboxyl-terminal processing protease
MMSRKIKYRIVPVIGTALLITLIIAVFGASSPDNSRKERVLLEQVLRSLTLMHFDPLTLDDTFSNAVFEEYLSSLDFNKKFLLQSDIDRLAIHRTQIDDQLNSRNLYFFEAVDAIIPQRIEEASAYYSEILAHPFDFTVEEEIELDGKKNPWAASVEELRDEWRKALKYQVMLRVHQALEIRDAIQERGDTVAEPSTFEEIERTARESVEKTHSDYFDRMKKLTREDRYGMYLNAIGSVNDPHTNYYPPKVRDDFDIQMSGRLEGIGAVLTQRGGYIHVEEIMPGSPSWKQGELKSGDIILKVAQGAAEAVDVTSMRLDEAVRLIRGAKGTEVRLTVRKKVTDEIVVIAIIRDVVEMEQTWARSAIITAPDGKRIGYIFLPKFYVDFNNPFTGRNCSRDVEQELRKLTAEGIDALVFDLRNNGGGSLQDVVRITGLFIPRGPVVQVRDKLEGHEVMRSTSAQPLYDGPMVVMVNAGSASASEIMAAALQDYRRAVIVGSVATFGKGTVQRMIDLDMLVSQSEAAVKPLGSLKLTTQKFYRIDGGATQLRGVTSDIVLPDRYDHIDFGEKSLDNAMAWSRVNPVPFQQWTGTYGKVSRLKTLSEQRVETHEAFTAVAELSRRFERQRDESRETLHLERFREKQAERKKENEQLSAITGKETSLNISLTQTDATSMGDDTLRNRIMNEWVEALRKDIYLEETRFIVTDMLTGDKVPAGNAKRSR